MYGIFGKIRRLSSKGMDFGTERTRRILDGLGGPDKKLKIIHIAGSNGKGSVAEYITRILIEAGKRVGTFTSPFVYNYFEQFKTDGKPFKKNTLKKYFKEAYGYAKALNATEFEVETAGAIYAFYGEGCEYAVLECGLGGLNDATNAIAKKEVAVITTIGLEHTKILGNTLEEICSQKCGIIKNCPAVVSAFQEKEILNYFKSTPAIIADDGLEIFEDGFLYGGEKYETGIEGSVQPYNASVAIEVCKLLGIDKSAISSGLKKAKLAGRLEVIKKDKTYILDGSHNPQSFIPLKNLLCGKYVKDGVTVIYGCLSDKDYKSCLSVLKSCAGRIITVPTCGARGFSLEGEAAESGAEYCKSVKSALKIANGEVVCVCGSFTILKEAYKWIKRRR